MMALGKHSIFKKRNGFFVQFVIYAINNIRKIIVKVLYLFVYQVAKMLV